MRNSFLKTVALATAALAGVALLPASSHAQQIIINEFYRGGTLTGTGDEFIELLLLQDLTATQLNTFFVGDSTAQKMVKFSAFSFTNMGNIASSFRAGTLIVVGGTNSGVRPENTAYNPTGGDWDIVLTLGGTFLPNVGSSPADIAGDDIIWVDTSSTGTAISANGNAVDIGTASNSAWTGIGTDFGASTNNTGYALNSNAAGAGNTANWTTGITLANTTPGNPNGLNNPNAAANTAFINSLRAGGVSVNGPEPASLALLVPAFCAAGVVLRRRKG